MSLKLFGKWDTSGIEIKDPGLHGYINLKPLIVPKTSGRNVKKQFWKNKNSIIERLINKMMVAGHKGKKHKLTSGRNSGQAYECYNIVKEALGIIEKKLNKNPIEVFVKAIENAAPREEITTIEYGGAKYPAAVDCSPQRRVDLTLRLMTQGAYHKSFNSKTKVSHALADEIMNAYQGDQTSNAIAKKIEVERQAESSR